MASRRLSDIPSDWAQVYAGVIGGGISGVAAAKLLHGAGARVLLSEKSKLHSRVPKGIDVELGRHSDRLLNCHLLIRSPGVPSHVPVLEAAVARKIPVWSELELATRFIHPKRLIAITGTNGKTTTTTLAGQFFKAWKKGTVVGGNIGTPLSELAPRITVETPVVAEVSSYQLEDIEMFHPQFSAILNVTPDHLEHHGSMKAYAAAKARIFENQRRGDVCVLNADDVLCRRLARHCRADVLWFSRRRILKSGISFENGDVVLRWRGRQERWPLRWRLPGAHNVENALAAIALAAAAGIPERTIRTVLSAFKGVEHRLEQVRELAGVTYVNDSKGTNVDSTRVALESFTQPLIVILGGQGKGAPYAPLASLVQKKAKRLLLIGEDAPTIAKELKPFAPVERVGTMAKAVRRARQLGAPGDVVLLSPACASFDQYRNYEERGRHFKSLVRQLR